jgi:hypothetical protein
LTPACSDGDTGRPRALEDTSGFVKIFADPATRLL